MNFDYNTTRSKLILSEYGRNIQNMVNYICQMPDKEQRDKYAQAVIDLMGFLNPHLRDVTDFKHKLWDHLHIISNNQIDVESPYPKPDMEKIHRRPECIPYPHQRIKYKHYGKTVENLIQKAIELKQPEQKAAMVSSIANFMKLAYVQWNKEHISDETILKDLHELSGGQLTIDENINLNKVELKTNTHNKHKNNKKNLAYQKNRPQHKNNGKRF